MFFEKISLGVTLLVVRVFFLYRGIIPHPVYVVFGWFGCLGDTFR